MLRPLIAALALTFAALPAAAQGGATKLVLAETVSREVEEDTIVAALAAQAKAPTAREAQAAANTLMTAAVADARAVAAVRLATGPYRVWQERDRDGRVRGWVAQQELRLTASEATPLLELVGMLQGKGLAVGTLGYTLSSDARRRVERELTAEALAALRARAEQVAEALGLRVAAIETLRVGGTALPPPLPRGMAMRADAAEAAPPPVALPDRETVSLSVDAEVRLEAR